MKSFLVILCCVLCICQSETDILSNYETKRVSQNARQISIENKCFHCENFKKFRVPEEVTEPEPLFYVTPVSKIETSEINARPVRKSRRNAPQRRLTPPSTSYGVPFLDLPISLQTNSSDDQEVEKATERTGSQYYLPPDEDSNEETIVNRNIYFYKAPADFESLATRKPIKVPKPQINYKVIFIKAPNAPIPPPVVQFAPQNVEKTVVYVLAKKSEDQVDIIVPTPAPTKASKPEVYFIKYGTQKENIEKSEKTYGIPQYGKGYYYAPENNENPATDKSDEEEDAKEENSNKTRRKKKNSFFRGTKSSSLDRNIRETEFPDSIRYFTPPQLF